MTVNVQYQSKIPVAAQVTLDGQTHLVPIRKSVEGWEPDLRVPFTDRESLFKLQLAIAAAVLGL